MFIYFVKIIAYRRFITVSFVFVFCLENVKIESIMRRIRKHLTPDCVLFVFYSNISRQLKDALERPPISFM